MKSTTRTKFCVAGVVFLTIALSISLATLLLALKQCGDGSNVTTTQAPMGSSSESRGSTKKDFHYSGTVTTRINTPRIISKSTTGQADKNEAYCSTQACQITTKLMEELESHQNVYAPCENFFDFICNSGFGSAVQQSAFVMDNKETTAKPGEKIQIDTEMSENIKGMLLRTDTNSTHNWLQKAQIFYKSCLKSGTFDKINQSDLVRELAKDFSSYDDPAGFLGVIRFHYALNVFFYVSYSMSLPKCIELRQPSDFFLNSELHRNRNRFRQLYDRKLQQVKTQLQKLASDCDTLLQALNVTISSPTIDELMALESSFVDLTTPLNTSLIHWGDSLDNTQPIKETIEFWDHLTVAITGTFTKEKRCSWSWSRFLFGSKSSKIVEGTEKLLVRNGDYMTKAVQLICKTPMKLLKTYSLMHFLSRLQKTFYSRKVDSFREYQGIMDAHGHFWKSDHPLKQSTDKERSLDQKCIDKISFMFPPLPVQVLKRQLVTEDATNELKHMEMHIKNTAKELLKSWTAPTGQVSNQSWLNQKIDSIKVRLTYPMQFQDDNVASVIYETLIVKPENNYMENALQYLQYYSEITMTESYQAFVFGYYPFYIPMFNLIGIQPYFLHKPYFDARWPSFMKFASLGLALAHELAHAFDRTGSHYSVHSSYVSERNWTRQFLDQLQQRHNCLKAFYEQLPIGINGSLQVDGVLTLGENFADILGLRLSFHAYKAYWNDRKKQLEQLGHFDQKLLDKLFFASIARGIDFCSGKSEEDLLISILTETHTLPELRLLGMLQNSKEFADAFECSSNAFMNPSEKCDII